MNPLSKWRLLPIGALTSACLYAQDWTDAELLERAKGFQQPSLTVQMEQVAPSGAANRAFTPVVARLHGDYREHRLKVDRPSKS